MQLNYSLQENMELHYCMETDLFDPLAKVCFKAIQPAFITC